MFGRRKPIESPPRNDPSGSTGMASGKTPLAVEQALLKRVPAHYMQHAHHWLILHGRYICKARKPECWRCVARAFCNYPDKTPSVS